MKILITGTTGYIAKRLALQLLEDNHELVCCVRDMSRIPDEIEENPRCTFIKIDFLGFVKKLSASILENLQIAK